MYYLQYFVAVGLVHLHVHFVSFWESKLYRKSCTKPLQMGFQMPFTIIARFVLYKSQLDLDLGTQHTPDRLSHFWGGASLFSHWAPVRIQVAGTNPGVPQKSASSPP